MTKADIFFTWILLWVIIVLVAPSLWQQIPAVFCGLISGYRCMQHAQRENAAYEKALKKRRMK